jgi:VCBS repeat-containing protein
MSGATVSLGTGYAPGEDQLSWEDDPTDSIMRDISSTDQSVVLTGAGSAAQYEAALRAVRYVNTSEAPGAAQRSVTFAVTDAGSATGTGTGTGTGTIRVMPVNDPPHVSDDSASTDEDTTVSTDGAGGVLLNDTDAEGDDLSVVLVNPPAHAASFTLNADGSYSYTPAVNYNGADSFTYKANDGSDDSTTNATVSIAVSAADDAPLVSGGGTLDYSENQPARQVSDSVAVSDPDAAGLRGATVSIGTGYAAGEDRLSWVDDPADAIALHGSSTEQSVVLTGAGTAAEYEAALRAVQYANTSDAPSTAARTVTFAVTDASDTSGSGVATIDVASEDDRSEAEHDAQTIGEDSGAATIAVRSNDADVDSAVEKVESVATGTDTHGTVAITNDGDELTYTPAQHYCNSGDAPATFTYSLAGGSSATVSVTVTCVNDEPVAAADSGSTDEDVPLTVAAAQGVLANDTDPDGGPLTATKVSDAAHGAVTLNPDGSYRYEPAPDYHGEDSFAYRASDGAADSSTATVTITVGPVDDAPAAADDAITVRQDAASSPVDVLANDTDVDGGPKRVAAVDDPSRGQATVAADGSGLSYAPDPDYCNSGSDGGGPDTFGYTLDGGSRATVAVTVECREVPDPDPEPQPQPAGRVVISHPITTVSRRSTLVTLLCTGDVDASCTGSLALGSTRLRSRLAKSAGNPGRRFTLVAGQSTVMRLPLPDATRKQLAKRRKAVVRATARTSDGATVKRLLTLFQR